MIKKYTFKFIFIGIAIVILSYIPNSPSINKIFFRYLDKILSIFMEYNSSNQLDFKFIDVTSPIETQDLTKDSYEFSVLSYNILADCYVKPHYFKYANPKFTEFKYRSEIIAKELQALNSDIIIFQEMDNVEQYYNGILTNLGYKYVNKSRRNKADSLLIAYKKDKFELLKEASLDFDDVSKYNIQFKDLYDESYFSLHNVAVVLTLRDIKTSNVVNVLGTHFFWDPKKEDCKYLQAYLVQDYLSKNFKPEDVVVWGGDLNSTPGENVVEYITKRAKPDEKKITYYKNELFELEKRIFEEDSKETSRLEWNSLYELYGPSIGQEKKSYPDHTTFTKDFKAVLDYLYYNPKIVFPKKLLFIPTADEIKEVGLPSQRYPSDHLPIMGVFGVNPQSN